MSYEFRGNTASRGQTGTGRRPAAPRAAHERGAGRSPMQTFAALVGAAFLLIGIAGFIPGLTENLDGLESNGPESTAELLGIFQVSILHNVVHLLFGIGLLAAARYSWSRLYLLGGGLVYLVVALYGAFVDRASDANFLPINGADTVLHLVLSLGMIALGLLGTRLSEGTPATRS